MNELEIVDLEIVIILTQTMVFMMVWVMVNEEARRTDLVRVLQVWSALLAITIRHCYRV